MGIYHFVGGNQFYTYNGGFKMRKDNLNELTEEQKKEAERLNMATTVRNRQLAKTS